jgi:NADH-quinone oxidoreductase subunit K
MVTMLLDHVLMAAMLLFAVGLTGVIARRNLIMTLLSVETMLSGAAVAFIAAGAYHRQADGQIMFFFILATAAVEVSVGLALALRHDRTVKSLDVDAAGEMRG